MVSTCIAWSSHRLANPGLYRDVPGSGTAPPVAEMQARWAVEVVRKAITLPAPKAMRAMIAARRALISRTRSNPYRLNAEAYQDQLAAEIGALPQLWRHPALWRAILAARPSRHNIGSMGHDAGREPPRRSGKTSGCRQHYWVRVTPVTAAPRTEQA